jgi:hypothetical protein
MDEFCDKVMSKLLLYTTFVQDTVIKTNSFEINNYYESVDVYD